MFLTMPHDAGPHCRACNTVRGLPCPDHELWACNVQIVTIFGEYQAAQRAAGSQPVPVAMARRLDGALLAIGTLSDTLKTTVSASRVTDEPWFTARPPNTNSCCLQR